MFHIRLHALQVLPFFPVIWRFYHTKKRKEKFNNKNYFLGKKLWKVCEFAASWRFYHIKKSVTKTINSAKIQKSLFILYVKYLKNKIP